MFPGSEDYEEGCSPVRDLTLLEQIEYWKTRACLAEECAYANLERVVEPFGRELRAEWLEDGDSGEAWKRA